MAFIRGEIIHENKTKSCNRHMSVISKNVEIIIQA